MHSRKLSEDLRRDVAADAVPTVANQLATELSKRVLEGRYLPGANLREVPLAEEFGVSRSSIRG
jgi:DNA-binding GntR family transcriptional regulator